MSYQLTLSLTASAISSQALAAGPLLSSSQDGQKTSLSGQGVFPATLSARQAREQGLMTSGTYGQLSFGSSSSVALQSSLASKLVQSLPLSGGISWHLTWRARTTPRLRQICQLRASGLRIGEIGCSGWGTPTVQDGNGRDRHNQRDGSIRLSLLGQARAMWSTPVASDGKSLKRSPQALKNRREKKYGLALPEQTASLITGASAGGSTAWTASEGQLNPAFVCWLMGFPAEWRRCAVLEMPSSRK